MSALAVIAVGLAVGGRISVSRGVRPSGDLFAVVFGAEVGER